VRWSLSPLTFFFIAIKEGSPYLLNLFRGNEMASAISDTIKTKAELVIEGAYFSALARKGSRRAR
jgi:hypothetical protein